jgi:sugar phosphate isomerase/epimerase
MDRRRFVQRTALAMMAGRTSLLGRLEPGATAPVIKPLGLELYTVRRELSADPERTLAAVAAIGYSYVEVVWPLLKTAVPDFRRMLDRAGLAARSGHIGTAVLENGWEAQIESARAMGHEYVFVASLPGGQKRTLDDWRAWADRFNRAGQVARRSNLWLGFHTEPDNFAPIDGKVPYDALVERLDPAVVRLQLDVGNVAMGGADPMQYLTRWRDRYASFHIKDVPTIGKVADTELGRGVLDLKGLLKAAGDLSGKLLYVEQEGSADAIDSSRRNYAYLSNLRL